MEDYVKYYCERPSCHFVNNCTGVVFPNITNDTNDTNSTAEKCAARKGLDAVDDEFGGGGNKFETAPARQDGAQERSFTDASASGKVLAKAAVNATQPQEGAQQQAAATNATQQAQRAAPVEPPAQHHVEEPVVHAGTHQQVLRPESPADGPEEGVGGIIY